MANEEIEVKMGLNTSGFRTELEKAKSLAGGFKSGISEVGGDIAKAFSAAAIVGAVNSVREFTEEIERTAKITGLSTDTIQGINYAMTQTGGDAADATNALEKLNLKIGEARDGNEGAIKSFQKLGIPLSDAQTMLGQIADKMAGAGSAAEQAEIAFEAFGKSGKELIPILQGGSAALQKMIDTAPKLSEDNIKNIERFNRTLKESGTTAEVWGGKLLGGIADISYALGNLVYGIGPVQSKLDAVDEKRVKSANAFRQKQIEIAEQAKAYNEALDERKKKEDERLEGEQKYSHLYMERADLQKQIDAMQDGTVEKVKALTEMDKISFDLAKQKSELERQDSDKKLQAANRLLSMQKEINNAAMAKRDAAQNLEEARKRKTGYTVEELAKYANEGQFSNNATVRKDQGIAQQIEREENDLQNSGIRFNNPEAAKAEEKDIERLRGQLSNNVPEDERHPFKSLQEAAQKTSDNLQTLLDKATNEGLNIKPVMAP